ncbi:potassium voltage-gated channel protein Shaw-like [Tubulanus polymorphus]|uniref:potassium voltage-gated channel protein Shaw-like n=1 Tax=Tubulanus polymorphus TaxID=672921 RepID=UPI003DA56822
MDIDSEDEAKKQSPSPSRRRVSGQERIRLNVGGTTFQALRSTLTRHPNTVLSELNEHDQSYDSTIGEYFFDRNPLIFSSVLEYYRTGELHIPSNLCGPAVHIELEFWGMKFDDVAPCCQTNVLRYDVEVRKREELLREFDGLQDVDEVFSNRVTENGIRYWRWRLWLILEHPRSSIAAKVWSVFYGLIVLMSIIMLLFHSNENMRILLPNYINMSDEIDNYKNKLRYSSQIPWILYTDVVIMAISTLEILTRILVSPNRKRILTSILGLAHIICVITFWFLAVVRMLPTLRRMRERDDTVFTVITVLWAFQALRILRIFELSRQFLGLNVLLLALKRSKRELFLLVLFICLGAITFSFVVFYLELSAANDEGKKSQITTVPTALYWAVITMTTVGYGDVVPITAPSKTCAVLCSVTGMVLTSLAIPIISNKFYLYYNFVQAPDIQEYIKTLNKTWHVRMDQIRNARHHRYWAKSMKFPRFNYVNSHTLKTPREPQQRRASVVDSHVEENPYANNHKY